MNLTAAVIGHPVSHSLSPALFSFLSKQLGCELVYEALDVKPEELQNFISQQKKNPSRLGFNVTIPHKEKLFSLVDETSEAARAVGAINVIEAKNGLFKGHNTDVQGIRDSFRLYGVSVKSCTVIVLGAGGAARAAAYAGAAEGASKVIIVNRTSLKANAIAKEFSTLFPGTEFTVAGQDYDFAKENAKVVIQATPMGMSGAESDVSTFEKILSGPQNFAFDLVYKPEETEFLKLAKTKGFKTMGGLSMLIGQALATWEIWFAPLPDKNSLFEPLTVFLKNKLAVSA